MKVVKKIFAIILMLFITLSSVGISFYLHHCGCRDTTLFSFEAGYSEANEFCCCSVEKNSASESSCCDEVKTERCCLDEYFFLLLPLGPEKITSDLKLWDGKALGFVNPHLVVLNDLSNLVQPEATPKIPPLILSGKLFVYFTHQIKIPFPIS